MRRIPVVITLAVWAGLGLAEIGAAQTAAHPTIHNVTLHQAAGVLTVIGTGFGRDPTVTVAGQPVIVLAGGTETQIDVVVPAAVLTTPGTYRLTLVDPVRQVGDAFVVASHAGVVLAGDGAGRATVSETAPATTGSPVTGATVTIAPRPLDGPTPLVVEDCCFPWRTALGYQALISNTSGINNTAIGYEALRYNTQGASNTASGYQALYFNQTGSHNTASGEQALRLNSSGNLNTASGQAALYSNTTGGSNTANGVQALFSNTTGNQNTASGMSALSGNTTANYNTASGYEALYANTTGGNNTASGIQALYSNGAGWSNTANGSYALYANTGEANTASGQQALRSNETGGYNTAGGYQALYANTTGHENTASGSWALASNTTGESNMALGVRAGFFATTGSYNLFLGADVRGTTADTNTIRIGLPYSGGVGQNQTFIAGIHGTALTGSPVAVFIDANGRLGTVLPPAPPCQPPSCVGLANEPLQQALRQLADQEAINADLHARLARLEARLAPSAGRK
jgi:hypothetical protein